MKLELKHISPYALHKLRVFVSQKYKGDWLGVITDVDYHTRNIKIKCDEKDKLIWKYQPLSNVKPILRPLSDLLNHELDFWIELGEILGTMSPDHFTNALIDKTTYALSPGKWLEVSEFLDSNHFDWRFDLIKNNLAIDTNRIK